MKNQQGNFISNNASFKCGTCDTIKFVNELLEISTGWFCLGNCLIEGLKVFEEQLKLTKKKRCDECDNISDLFRGYKGSSDLLATL